MTLKEILKLKKEVSKELKRVQSENSKLRKLLKTKTAQFEDKREQYNKLRYEFRLLNKRKGFEIDPDSVESSYLIDKNSDLQIMYKDATVEAKRVNEDFLLLQKKYSDLEKYVENVNKLNNE